MKQRIRFLFLSLAICLMLAVTTMAVPAEGATFSGGTGTAEDPYQINTKADMETLADALTSSHDVSRGRMSEEERS